MSVEQFITVPSAPTLDPNRVTVEMVRDNPEVRKLIDMADKHLCALGYTDHGFGHVNRVAIRAQQVLRELRMPQREVELAGIAAYLHDIGNMIHRRNHAHHSALMSVPLLQKMGMPLEEIAVVTSAIANHDESDGQPVSNVSAALIIADKSDVLRSRVRNPKLVSFDIHDRVNYAAMSSELVIEREKYLITLKLKVDTVISPLMEYFEIFLTRMKMSREAAKLLNCDYQLVINGVPLS